LRLQQKLGSPVRLFVCTLKTIAIVLGLVVLIIVGAVGVTLLSSSSPQGSSPNSAPSFTYTVSGNTYTFQAETGFSNYIWDFGDGSSGTGSTISHTYHDSGTYMVSLTASPLTGSISPLSTSHQIDVTIPTTTIHQYFEYLNLTVGGKAI
jgi:PKD domain